MKIILAQSSFILGDIQYNQELVIDTIQKHSNCDLIIFPELFLTGYPPEDLLLRHGMYKNLHKSLMEIHKCIENQTVLLGLPRTHAGEIYNSCAIMTSDPEIHFYDKQRLPNYSVFDEKRYFSKGAPQNNLIHVNGKNVFIAICQDTWHRETYEQAKACNADFIVSLQASPFHRTKTSRRHSILSELQQSTYPVPLIYVNCVGAQDELIFDGNSFVLNSKGEISHQLKSFEDDIVEIDFDDLDGPESTYKSLSGLEELHKALVIGIRDYYKKNNFKSCLIGLSGGIDSAVTACLAREALGAENVHTVSMPTRYTSDMSKSDAAVLAENLGINFQEIPIEPIFKCFLDSLKPAFNNKPEDLTEENLQSRIRGTMLMALSNKHGHMVLTTSNKSEIAVGYSTLYGDTAGGFCALKDVYKTEVFELAKYINRDEEIIPSRIITRPPSAELRDNQTDQDSLPDYDILDAILEDFIEKSMDITELTEKYNDEALIVKIVSLIRRNEYKRRQSPPGVKTTRHAFGRDWRYPISENYIYK